MSKFKFVIFFIIVSIISCSPKAEHERPQLDSATNEVQMSEETSKKHGSWAEIDFWELGISERPCTDDDKENSRQLCELTELSHKQIEKHIETLDQRAPEGEYIVEYSEGILTILSLSNPKNSFICCDIQGPFRKAVSTDGRSFSFAQYRVPVDGIFKIELLNGVKSSGPKLISVSPDEYQKTYIELFSSEWGSPISKKLNLVEVDREIYLFKSHPSLPPQKILYFMDGDGMAPFIRAVMAQFNDETVSFAAVGIPGSDSNTRSNEYLKHMTKDAQAFHDHERQFVEKIVPQVEQILGGGFSRENRVLIGFSAGGTWVTNFYLDRPKFACSLIAVSIAGVVPDMDKSSLADELKRQNEMGCYEGYFSYGEYEDDAFIKDTQEIARRFREIGVDVTLFSEKSGHSLTSWIPSFLRSYESIVKPEH